MEFGIPMKLVRLIKMCLNETYSRFQVSKHLSDMFPIWHGLKQGDNLLPLLFNSTFENTIKKVRISFWFMLMMTYWEEVYILQRKMQKL